MDVSVIIVTRNTRAMTCAAIRSVLDTDDSFAKEIIVVDNGSDDDTATALSREFPIVKIIRSERNIGFARACNRAALQSHGEFVLLLNSDARLEPDVLGRAIGWMRTHQDCAVAGAQLYSMDSSRQNSIANFPTLATELLNKSLLRRLFPRRFPGKEQQFAEPVEVETVVGAFMLIRRSVWDALGGLDERFFFFFEETDFCLRVRRAAVRVMHLPGLRVWHEQGGTAKQFSASARIEYWRSRYAYFRKNHGPATLLILCAGLWVRLSADFAASFLLMLLSPKQSSRRKEKFAVQQALMAWHFQGCPGTAGLPR
jgi:GT2 family glycosyltransferase